MDDTKPRESVYSPERTEITGAHSLRSTTKKADSRESENDAPAPGEAQETPMTGSPVNASRVSAAPVSTRPSQYSLFEDLLEYLKGTRNVWLSLAGAVIVFMLAVSVVKGMAERSRIATEKRHEEAAATVTPDNLITRCGPAAEDVTKEMYPMVMRTMSYQARGNEKAVFEFSRTAEEKSVWVFLSMKDESGAKSYDSPEAKIAALPCLDLKK